MSLANSEAKAYVAQQINEAIAYLAQRYVNRDEQTNLACGTAAPPKTCVQSHGSCISTMSREAKARLDSRTHQTYTSTAISKAKAHLAQLYINRDHNSKAKHFCTTLPCRPKRYIRRHQQRESLHGTAAYEHRGTSTVITKANACLAQLCVNSNQQSKPLR